MRICVCIQEKNIRIPLILTLYIILIFFARDIEEFLSVGTSCNISFKTCSGQLKEYEYFCEFVLE